MYRVRGMEGFDSTTGEVGDEDPLKKLAREVASATLKQDLATTNLLEKNRDNAHPKSAVKSSGQELELIDISEFLLQKLASAQDVEEIVRTLGKETGRDSGRLSGEQCSQIVELSASLGNSNLSLRLVDSMRCSSFQFLTESLSGNQKVFKWEFPSVSVHTYTALVRGLAAALRVKDAVEAIEQLRRRGLPDGDEVPFGKIVDCPTCRVSMAVVQPQYGIQLAACPTCRYQYEVMSGDVVKCDSEALSGEPSVIDRALRLLRLKRDAASAAVHSMVVRAPDGVARTHRFATATPDIPAQPGERVSVSSAAPLSAKRRRALGLFSSSTRVPGWSPGEPMTLTNHVTGEVSPLLRAPLPSSNLGAAATGNWIVPAVLLLASSDAASGLIDPSLPALLAATAGTSLAVGAAANTFVLPKLNQLPERTADSLSPQQQLLEQHSKLESRLDELTAAAAQEVRMLARMWQLQNKMEAVGEPSTYSARMERVMEVRRGLDERLTARLELIDSYAKVSAMIEIEVEMSSDLLAAEAATATESIVEQIVKLEEVERLQTEWRQQAEANDEVERLLRSAPPLQE